MILGAVICSLLSRVYSYIPNILCACAQGLRYPDLCPRLLLVTVIFEILCFILSLFTTVFGSPPSDRHPVLCRGAADTVSVPDDLIVSRFSRFVKERI